MRKRYSLHKVLEENHYPFDVSAYSRFKFGDTEAAEKFAEDLFEGFLKVFKEELLEQSDIMLFPSPYYAIPTASNFLCSFFKNKLNYFLYENGKSACIEGKIHRTQTYSQDYGNMNYEERINLISNDTYYIDKHFIEGKFCIFLDDIKITGSHENTIDKILKEYDVNGEFIFVYFAELINKDIHPKIENHYNYFQIKTPKDLVELMNSEHYKFNTRITKYILMMNEEDFDFVIENISNFKKNEMLRLAISNNYHQVDEYIKNINKLIFSYLMVVCKNFFFLNYFYTFKQVVT